MLANLVTHDLVIARLQSEVICVSDRTYKTFKICILKKVYYIKNFSVCRVRLYIINSL